MFVSVAKGNEDVLEVEAATLDYVTLVLVASICIGIWFFRSRRSTLPRNVNIDPKITQTTAVLLFGAMFLLGGIGAKFGSSQVAEPSLEKTAWMYSSAMIAQIPVLLTYFLLHKEKRFVGIVYVSVITYIVFVPAALSVASIIHSLFSSFGWEQANQVGHETLAELIGHKWGSVDWVVIICVTVGAGIFEEILYRGLILPFFMSIIGRKTPWLAITTTSGLFALMHISTSMPSAILGLFILSIGLCWARIKSGGILSPILIHITFNAMNIAFVYSTHL
jgi:membrane protease YdiL (CAAX protease family)